jgi:hypothetical protein
MAHETAADFGMRFPSGLTFSEQLRDVAGDYSKWRYGMTEGDELQSRALIAKLIELTKQVRQSKH